MNLNDYATTAHTAAVAKGFYERHRDLPELLMLIVSELSEAMEADRMGKRSDYNPVEYVNGLVSDSAFVFGIKDSVEDEIADAFIRLFDLCGHLGIDIQAHVDAKMKYNETRPPKHGKAY